MSIDLARIRAQFPITENCAYLNHAAACPISLRVSAAVQALAEDQLRFGYLHADRWRHQYTRTRHAGAQLLHTSPERIAFIKSTTEGLSLAANGIDWRPGDNVVLPEGEFPTVYYPWANLARRGVTLRRVGIRPDRTISVDDIRQKVDGHTRAVVISFVQYNSGFRVDLPAISQLCRQHDLLLVVDGIQGMGALDLDAEACGADIIAADAHKFLLGPFSIGMMYVSPRALERLSVSVAGWLSMRDPFHFRDEIDFLPDARRFEAGTENNLGIFGLGAALDLFLETGMTQVEGRVLNLTQYLVEGLLRKGYHVLSPLYENCRSAIIIFNHPLHSNEDIKQRLDAANIVISLRGGGVRVSPHFYNSEEEIERLLCTLA